MDDRYNLNLLFEKGRSLDSYYTAQEITDEVFNAERLLISTLAMDMPAKNMNYRKGLEGRWIETLPKLDRVKSLSLRQRVGQQFFEAVCEMKNLEHLHFWTSTVTNLASISKLSRLKKLYLDSFSRLTDISPINNLHQLGFLSISSSFKIENYEVIGLMHQIVALGLQGDQTAPKNLRINSLEPFKQLKVLRHLDLSATTVVDKSYDVLLEMESLERFDSTAKISKPIRDKIKTHPRLKAGFFIDWDWDNKRFYADKDWSV